MMGRKNFVANHALKIENFVADSMVIAEKIVASTI